MGARIARATTADEIIAALVLGLEEFIEGEPGSPAVIYELLSASRHSEDIRAELAELYRRWRADLADSLRAKEREGVVRLEADPESVASMLFAWATASASRCSPIPSGIARPPSSWACGSRAACSAQPSSRPAWSACRTGSGGRPRSCARPGRTRSRCRPPSGRATTGSCSRSAAGARRCGACAPSRARPCS